MNDDLHSRLTAHVRRTDMKRAVAILGLVCVLALVFWTDLVGRVDDNPLGLRYTKAEIVDVSIVDDGKGDTRDVVVRYDDLQLRFQAQNLAMISDTGAWVCIKEWQGVSIPDAGTPLYRAPVLPSYCDTK